MERFSTGAVQAAYDAVARDYAAAFGDDLARLPLDRAMLDAAVAAVDASGWVVEVGCGPAAAAAYVADRAPRLVGLDLSAGMLDVAGARCPALRRVQGDLRRLPLRAGCAALVIAYYSVQHLPRAELPAALAEVHRVLARGGALLLATHLGEGDVAIDDFLGHRISAMGGALYGRSELVGALGTAGFRVVDERQRPPLPHEYDSQRIYVIAAAAG